MESLETKNQLLISQLESKDKILLEKDSVIRSLRQENTNLQHDDRNKQLRIVDADIQICELEKQISKLTEDLLRIEEMHSI